jgi:hypothetical protein
MNQFWWGHSGDAKGITWMSFNRLGASKLRGGMGFRDLDIFNDVLLAKQGWILLQFPESLVARVMKNKILPQCGFLVSFFGP